MATRDEHWQWTRRLDPNFGVRVLNVDVSSRTAYEAAAREAAAAAAAENAADGALELALGADDTSCTVEPLSAREWAAFSRRFLFLVPPADSFRCELGELLLDDRLNGDLFVKNVFISSLKKELDLGSGLNLRNLRLDRDRRAVLHASDWKPGGGDVVRAIGQRGRSSQPVYELLQAQGARRRCAAGRRILVGSGRRRWRRSASNSSRRTARPSPSRAAPRSTTWLSSGGSASTSSSCRRLSSPC